MSEPLRLLAVVAHPDDESLGVGGALAKAAAEGIETFVVTATRGERGRIGLERPGPEIVGPVRERELRRAVERLGVRELIQLGYPDGDLAAAPFEEVVDRIAQEIRRLRPQVVLTFDSVGTYGHPDHIAISQFTSAALLVAADRCDAARSEASPLSAPHRVDKLYWLAWDSRTVDLYQRSIGNEMGSVVDGVKRRITPWPDWAVTTHIDARDHWQAVRDAVECHQSQISGYGGIQNLTPAEHRELWGGTQTFYRVLSLVNGGHGRETDLFEGLR